ncbi:unnamed protein product [Alopecurus aequalis]
MAQYHDDEKPQTSDAESNVGIGLVRLKKPAYSKREVALSAESVTVVVELSATSSTMAREGLDLVVALDIEGDDVRVSEMKKAMEFLIMKLTPKDRLAIVARRAAASGIRLCPLRCMTPAGQVELRDLITSLPGLNLNIHDSFKEAVAIIRDRVHTEGRSACVVYVTDDDERRGNARSVDPGNVAVHTFGFGKKAGHELLTDMARKSPGGTFSWVPDGSNLTAAFARLLGGLLTIVAQDVQLTMTSRKKDVDAIVVPNGIDYRQTTSVNLRGEKEVTVFFGAIFSGEARKVLVNFTLQPSKNSQRFSATIAEAQLSYNAQQGLQTPTPRNILITRAPEPTATPGVDRAMLHLHAEEVRQQVVLAVRAAREHAQKDQLEKARYELHDANKAVDRIMHKDGQKMVRLLRDELVQLIKLMASKELYEEQGRPYALGNETSHGRQRAAGVEAVCLYDTPRMVTCFQQAKQVQKDPEAPVPTAHEDTMREIAANPLVAFAAILDIYIENAMKALQAIQKIVHTNT